MKKFSLIWMLFSLTTLQAWELLAPGQSVVILADESDNATVQTVAAHFADDIEAVSGSMAKLINTVSAAADHGDSAIVITGTLESALIQSLEKAGKVDLSPLQGEMERWITQRVEAPFAGVDEAYLVVGSDRRGCAYGLFSISEEMGVNPWYWWADVPVARRNRFSLEDSPELSDAPAVRYRGIFLNDEDWGLRPWAEAKIDLEAKDIGPKTYAKIFELLLRLKANIIWPAMHDCTKAFYLIEGNKEVADQYGILISTSHCEPMLRNNVGEWYSEGKGSWNYVANRKNILNYWESRLAEAGEFENIFTIGMRGIHDGSMPGGGSKRAKTRRLERVIGDQRRLLENFYGDPSAVPQIFCPYKEVLTLYQNNLKLPDDITIVWADDNHGFIRQLSDPKEQQRSGRAGVYYHLSYWGPPEDHLWLSSISPGLIWYEMSKSLISGADRFWVFNVGDIKPAEKELSFALDLAWKGKKLQSHQIPGWIENQMRSFFGAGEAAALRDLLLDYYVMAAAGKPEHLNRIRFSTEGGVQEAQQRIALSRDLIARVQNIKQAIAPEALDAYYQLIEYPVTSAANMNLKYLCREIEPEASKAAFDQIKEMTRFYNEDIAGGKWQYMMDWKPRNRAVFNYPASDNLSREPIAARWDLSGAELFLGDNLGYKWVSVPSLGASSQALTLMPEGDWKELEGDLPAVEIELNLPAAGMYELEVRTLPTHRIYDPMKLRYSLSMNGRMPGRVDVNSPSSGGHYGKGEWADNVLRGYSARRFPVKTGADGKLKLRIEVQDPGIVFDSLVLIEKEASALR